MRRIKKTRITLDDLEKMDREYLLPAEVAELLRLNAQCLRIRMRGGENFGFPIIRASETRVIIPRRAFIRWLRDGGTVTTVPATMEAAIAKCRECNEAYV